MTTIQLLERLKEIVDDCGSEQPKNDVNDIVFALAEKSKEYSDALSKAIRSIS